MSQRPRIVVLEHSPTAPLGTLQPVLEREADLVFARGLEDPAGAAAVVEESVAGGDYDAVVALGGPMGAYEVDQYPYLGDTLRLLRDALDRDRPIIGICLGSQLLAQVLGSPVYLGLDRGQPRELGYLPLRLTREGMVDPVISQFSGDPVLFWHQDSHDLPEDAVLLSSTDLYAVAAFRWGRWAYGLQFHLETDQEVLERRVARFPDKVADVGLDPEALLEQGRGYAGLIQRRADAVARLLAGWAAEARAVRSLR